jgi:23S rRNA (uracil1939-C5)-methyltransferase
VDYSSGVARGGGAPDPAGIMRGPVLRLFMSSIETDITELSHDGRGVAHVAGKAVFVAGALAGERVRARYTSKHRHYDEAAVEEVLRASPDRVEPRCRHFGVCGGCALQHLAPAAQLAAKQRALFENFERIGKVQPQTVLAPLTDSPWGYRRRGRLSAKFVEKKGRMLVGFRETNGRYVADIERCEVLHPAVGERIAAITAMLESLECKRDIPQIEVSAGDNLVALVFRHLKPLSAADTQTLIAFAQANDFAIFLQPGGIDSVAPLWPADAQLNFALPAYDATLDFRPLDFIQVNGGMNRRMIDHALALLDPQPTDRVLDLFCGLGNFTLPLARRAGQVVGVEGEAGLVQRARDNATRNGIANAMFYSADLAADQRATVWAKADYELLLLDPPRSGADAVLDYLPRKSTRRVVYVSCHPASLARDAGILVEKHGFQLKSAGVMDMFPHTAHVESIALFERR